MCSPSCAIQDGASFVLLSNSSSVPDCYHYGFRNLGALCGFTSVCPSYVLASVLGQDGAVHQSHSSPSQQTSSSVSRFPWRLNLASGTAAVFQEGPYLHKKRTRILVLVAQQVRRSHVALNIFMNSSSLQLWSIYLELMQPLPVFLLCIHLCKGLISSWMMPVTTLTLKQVMKIKFSLMWIFFYNYIVLILCGSRDLSQQLLTTSQFSQQSKPKLYKWAISIWALNPWFQAAKLLWRGKGYREKGLQ